MWTQDFTDRYLTQERQLTILTAIAAVLGGFAARQIINGVWRVSRGEKPPLNPAHADVPWRDALLFGGLLGLLVGITRIAARRGMTAGWKHWHKD